MEFKESRIKILEIISDIESNYTGDNPKEIEIRKVLDYGRDAVSKAENNLQLGLIGCNMELQIKIIISQSIPAFKIGGVVAEINRK